MKDSKDHHNATHQEKGLNTAVHCILTQESPRKTRHIQALNGKMLLLTKRRDRARLLPIVYIITVKVGQLAQHTLLMLQQKDLCFSLESEILKAEGVPERHRHICLSSTKEYTLSLKQRKIFPLKVISLTQTVWVLFLLVKKYSKLKIHCYVAQSGFKGWA